jgi:hypothetical protein
MRIAHGKFAIGRRKSAILFGLILVTTLVAAGTSYGQPLPAPSAVPTAPPLWQLDPLGQKAIVPTTCSANEDNNGSTLIGFSGLDGGPTGIPGFELATEVGLVVPHVSNRLFDTVTRASGAADVVQLPSSQIAAAIMPRFELGYRFGQATGELLFSYRFLNSQSTTFAAGDVVPAFGPGGVAVTSRLSINTFDLDYGSWEPITVLGVDMKWRVGVRTLLEYNDSEANNGTLFQSTSNYYLGAGPHAMVDFRRPLGLTGLALFGRIEAAMTWGTLDQLYTENVTVGGVSDFGQTRDHIYSQVTSLGLQGGVCWTPQWNGNFHVTAGYIFEHFWDMGTIATGTAAREEIDINGGFVRLEWNY